MLILLVAHALMHLFLEHDKKTHDIIVSREPHPSTTAYVAIPFDGWPGESAPSIAPKTGPCHTRLCNDVRDLVILLMPPWLTCSISRNADRGNRMRPPALFRWRSSIAQCEPGRIAYSTRCTRHRSAHDVRTDPLLNLLD